MGTAKKLEAARFPRNTEMWWCTDLGELTYSKNCAGYEKATCNKSHYAAPDAQEIGELLPREFVTPHSRHALLINRKESTTGGWWNVGYFGMFEIAKRSEAEARAAVWLWLRENNLV